MSFAIKNKKQLYPSITVNRIAPKNIQPGYEIFFKHEYEKILPPVCLYELNNVNISPEGIIFSDFEIFEPCLIDKSRKQFYTLKYLTKNYLCRKKIILQENEKYILVFDEWSNGYFHWMCDVLPRLMSIRDRLNDCILLLPENYSHPFISDSLKIFGFKGIQKIPNNTYMHASKLIMPTHIAPTGNYNPEVMRLLRDDLCHHFETGNLSLGEKIYVSRKKAQYRSVLNEEEVMYELKAHGFKEVCFEDYSFHDQIQICRNARYLISIHGSNLANMLFLPPGGKVLEFRKQGDAANNAYYSLAGCLDLNYCYQLCEFEIGHPDRPNGFNLRVNINLLKENILPLMQ